MRDKVLGMLIDKDNGYISGESISTSLDITRAGIWKHIKKLRADGYKIDSRPGLGYKLVGIPDILDQVILSKAIDTKTMGRTIEVHRTIDSTNNRARDLALEGAPEGALVISENQTQGRGRLGRNWESPEGKGIWMSLVLRPNIPPNHSPRMTTIAAMAVRNALHIATGLPVDIKWPNDIIISNKKVCGILTEMQGDIDGVHFIILGIGINANMTEEDFHSEFMSRAISLEMAMGEKVNRREIIGLVMNEFEKVYMDYIKDQDFEKILEESRKYSITLNKRVKVVGRDHSFEGRALDFHEDGSLLVEKDNGAKIKVMAGDVSIRGEDGYV